MCRFHVTKNLHEALPKSRILKTASDEIKDDFDFLAWANSHKMYGTGLFLCRRDLLILLIHPFQPPERRICTGLRSGERT